MAARNLLDMSLAEKTQFFNSFDTVLCDLDGVLWNYYKFYDGVVDGVNTLRELGKNFYFVTNNSTAPILKVLDYLKPVDAKLEEIIRPTVSIIWYLKMINFTKALYVVGLKCFRDELENAGFNVIYDEPEIVAETPAGLAEMIKGTFPEVGAVIIDVSFNLSYTHLQRSIEYIKRNNAIFICGASEQSVPFLDTHVIGPYKFVNIIKEMTQIEPENLSKPGKAFQKVLEMKLKHLDFKRVLFIGDSLETDMIFATNCGFTKLLPFTGITKENDLENWKGDEKFKPNYVADSIKIFDTIAKDLSLLPNKL